MADISDLFTRETPEQLTASTLRSTLENARNVNSAALVNVLLLIWENPWGLSPQQVFDLLGPTAGALLSLKAAIAPLLDSSGAGVEEKMPDHLTLSVAEDGTVSVHKKQVT